MKRRLGGFGGPGLGGGGRGIGRSSGSDRQGEFGGNFGEPNAIERGLAQADMVGRIAKRGVGGINPNLGHPVNEVLDPVGHIAVKGRNAHPLATVLAIGLGGKKPRGRR